MLFWGLHFSAIRTGMTHDIERGRGRGRGRESRTGFHFILIPTAYEKLQPTTIIRTSFVAAFVVFISLWVPCWLQFVPNLVFAPVLVCVVRDIGFLGVSFVCLAVACRIQKEWRGKHETKNEMNKGTMKIRKQFPVDILSQMASMSVKEGLKESETQTQIQRSPKVL